MEPKWEWVDTVLGGIAGVIASVISIFGWLAPKFDKLETDTDTLREEMLVKIDAVHQRVTTNAQEIARLRAHREDDLRRLQSIDTKLDRIIDSDKKLDKILDRIPGIKWVDPRQ